jgi:hypothetical protein
MSDSQALDAYDVVLADLRAKRDQLDKAIEAIEALRAGKPSAVAASPAGSAPSAVDGPGAFLGMTITDAAKALLAARRKPLNNVEIVAAFKSGGLHMNSADPVNTVGSVLTRRFNQIGDIVRVGRGTWGLKEWYPNRNFKKVEAKGAPEPEPDVDAELASEDGGPNVDLA